ncbi:MAG: Calx-beta domain-containing protein [Pirellula sp.]|jgi:hypothetical protein
MHRDRRNQNQKKSFPERTLKIETLEKRYLLSSEGVFFDSAPLNSGYEVSPTEYRYEPHVALPQATTDASQTFQSVGQSAGQLPILNQPQIDLSPLNVMHSGEHPDAPGCCCPGCAATFMWDSSLEAQESGGASGGSSSGSGGPTTPAPLSETFRLHSNPGAKHTIYLDFDGHVTTGTIWNAFYTNGNSFTTPAFNFEGDSSAFTNNELTRIQWIWARVSEDFLAFNVNVTTQDPGVAALSKTTNDTEWGVRVVIGGSSSQWYGASVGGIAYVGTFNWSNDTPVYVFPSELAGGNEKFVANAASHEVGHALGLSHHGRTNPFEEYYTGHGSGDTGWAPIMGNPYQRNLTTWSRAEYANPSNPVQDDLQIITTQNGFGYRTDDHGNARLTATQLTADNNSLSAQGIIETRSDLDVFSFSSHAGQLEISANPAWRDGNLDILLELFDSSFTFIASSNPSELLGASISQAVAAGNYFLRVSGVGKGNPATDGYSDYGSLGQYRINATLPSPPLEPVYLEIVATDADKTEGNSGTTTYTVTINRSGLDLNRTTTVNYAVTGQGANPSSASDFAGGVLPSGTITFTPGQTSQTLQIQVAGDTTVESDESFVVTLSNPSAFTVINTATATGVVRNDDFHPDFLSVLAFDADKPLDLLTASTSYLFVIQRVGENLDRTSTVQYVVAGHGDQPAAPTRFLGQNYPSGTITFAPGQTSYTLVIEVVADGVIRPDESFRVTLENAVEPTFITTASAVGIIRNNFSSRFESQLTKSGDAFIGVSGQERFYTLTFSDPAEPSPQADYDIFVNWGDNSADQQFIGRSGIVLSHTYSQQGQYEISVRLARLGRGSNTTLDVNILSQELQGNVMAFGGNVGNELFNVTQLTNGITRLERLGEQVVEFIAPTDGVRIFGAGGADTIVVNGTVNADTFTITTDSIRVSPLLVSATAITNWQARGLEGDDSFRYLSGSALLDGGAGSNLLTGADKATQWTIDGINAGSVYNARFNNFGRLMGGISEDQFVLSQGGNIESINGGSGNDRLSYIGWNNSVDVNLANRRSSGIALFSSLELLDGQADQSNTLRGANSSATWQIVGDQAGTVGSIRFQSFDTLIGGSSRDRFYMMNADARVGQIVGGGGPDELYGAAINNVWEIEGDNAGLLNEVTRFSGIVSLRGGISEDQFLITQGGRIDSLNGGSGNDCLSYIGWNNSVDVNLASRSASGIGLFNSLEILEGQADQSNTIRGANRDNTWRILGDRTGTVGSLRFQSFDTLIGGSALDRFYMMNAEARVGQIVGGGGLDELYGADVNNVWKIEGSSDGLLNQVTRFSGITSLRGGAGRDWFRVVPGVSFSGSVLGGSGLDALDYAEWSSSVSINLVTGVSTGVTGPVSSFEIFVGGSGNDILTAGGAATVMVGNAGDDLLTSGGRNDILIGGTGNNRLQGGLGSDLLIGGSTRFDSHAQALADLLAEWSSSRTYQQRIDNLRGVGTGERLNGNTTLGADPSDSIFADAAGLNEILGGTNVDWFIAKEDDLLPDRVLSGSAAERLDLLSGINR